MADTIVEQARAFFDALVKSRFIEMFGYVKTNTARWRTVTVDSVTSSRLGKMLDKKQQTGKNLHKYLGNHNVKWFEFDFNSLSEMDFDNEDQKEFSLQYGDVLMCEGGDVGRCAVWKCELSDCYYQKALHRIRCSDELNPFFFVHLIKQMADSGCLENSTNTSTISHLTGVKLKKMKIVLPPIKLQNRFVDFLQQVDKSKSIFEREVARYDKLIKSRFIEMFGFSKYPKTPLSELLTQYYIPEKIEHPEKESYITLSSYGKGIKKRIIGEGKTPVPFTGTRLKKGQFVSSRLHAKEGAFALVPEELENCVVSRDFPVFTINTEKINPHYLLSAVLQESFYQQFLNDSFGSTTKRRIKEDVFLEYQIPLPPITLQNKYADFCNSIEKSKGMLLESLKKIVPDY